MQPARMTTQLRRLMAAPGLIRAVNVYDPLTARMAQAAGFKMIALGASSSAPSCASPSRHSP